MHKVREIKIGRLRETDRGLPSEQACILVVVLDVVGEHFSVDLECDKTILAVVRATHSITTVSHFDLVEEKVVKVVWGVETKREFNKTHRLEISSTFIVES